jgi:hypothetical protein
MTRYTPQWLQAGSYPASVDRLVLNALWPTPATTGFVIAINTGTMTAYLSPGKAAVPVAGGGTALCVSDANELVTVPPAPGSGLARWDGIYCVARGNDIDGGANNDFVFEVASGAPFTPPADLNPVAPPNSLLLWMIKTAGGTAAIDPSTVFDQRPGALAVPNPNITSMQRNLAADIALPVGTAAVVATCTGAPGHTYLATWHVTSLITAPATANVVGVWATDNAAASNSSGASSQDSSGWTTTSGSGIWVCGAANPNLVLNAYTYFSGCTIKAQNPNGVGGASGLRILDIGTQAPL